MMRLELHVSDCEHCHREADQVAVFMFAPKTGTVLINYGWPLINEWLDIKTAEKAVFPLEVTIGQLCADPVEAIKRFQKLGHYPQGGESYEDVLMRLIEFTAKVRQYPNATIVVEGQG